MRLLNIVVTILFFFPGCIQNSEIHSLYRWKSLTTESDSIIIKLEEGFVNSKEDLYLASLLDSLSNKINKSDNPSQMKCRWLYWKARIANRKHMKGDKTVEYYLTQAYWLCDTTKFSYDYYRIKYLLSLTSENDVLQRFKSLKSLEDYYLRTHDNMMLASVNVDLGHLMGETGNYGRALDYFKYADSLYLHLNIEPYHKKHSLNIASSLLALGNKREAGDIINELLSDNKTSYSPSFFINLNRVAYLTFHDVDFLLDAEHHIDSVTPHTKDKMPIELLLTKHYLEKKEFAKALHHSLIMNDAYDTPAHTYFRSDALKASALANHYNGNYDKALDFYKHFIEYNDSASEMIKSIEITNLENLNSILKYESESQHNHKVKILRLWIIITLLLFMSSVVIIILIIRHYKNKRTLAKFGEELQIEKRKLVSSELAMTEKDNVLQAVLSDLDNLKKERLIPYEATVNLEKEIKHHLGGRQDWEYFKQTFNKVCPEFVNNLTKNHPEITEGDIRLAIYIRAGLTTKQIAQMLLLQPDSIKKNRQRLRRRMNLSSDASLEETLRSL